MSLQIFVAISLQIILVEHLITVDCNSFNHTAGSRSPFGINLLHEGDLFQRVTTDPRNYSIAFKYHAHSFSGPPFFVQLNVKGAQNSTAKIEHSKEIDSTRDRTVDAFVNANNATNLTSTIEIRGLAAVGSDALDNFAYLIGRKTFKPRSYAAICVRNPIHRLEHRGHILQIGERQPNDILIRFQRGIVKLRAGIYPRYIFDFDDPQVNITHVAITANSPQVVIFRNKILMNNHQFRATLYGLTPNTFNATLIIYGTKT